MRPNKSMHTNRRQAFQFRCFGFFGRWIRSQCPPPAAVGDLHRWPYHVMKAFIVLFFSCASLVAGEALIPLKSGETNMVSYGLCCIVSDLRSPVNDLPGADLILTLRNNGAKWIGMQDVSAEDFSLRDVSGQDIKVHLRTLPPSGLAYGEVAAIHLAVDHPSAPQPWTLHFKCKHKTIVDVDVTITGIAPKKK